MEAIGVVTSKIVINTCTFMDYEVLVTCRTVVGIVVKDITAVIIGNKYTNFCASGYTNG